MIYYIFYVRANNNNNNNNAAYIMQATRVSRLAVNYICPKKVSIKNVKPNKSL